MAIFRNRSFPLAAPDWSASLPAGTVPIAPTAVPEIPAAKPSFFGAGGTGRAIAGYLGDALARMGGGQGVYQQAMQQHQQEQSALAQALLERQWAAQDHSRNRQEGNEDWLAHERFKLENQPKPVAVQIADEAGLQGPDRAAALKAAIPGYGYTDSVLQAKATLAQQTAASKAALSLRNKQAPTYTQMHPKAGGGGKTTATRVVDGKAYYKVNGGWYDNPEGR